jgi:hypothetical protein
VSGPRLRINGIRNMPIQLEISVRTLADLTALEMRLRDLHLATSGVQCQALLTTEYRLWKHEVSKRLLNVTAGEKECLEAFLPGVRLAFSENSCSVSQLLPRVAENSDWHTHHRLRKRKAWSSETVSVGRDI